MEEPAKKLEVAEDGRSIGYWDESQDPPSFTPLILWGFRLHSYVSSDCGPGFRGVKAEVKTISGKSFWIDWKHKDLISFRKCQEACVEQGYGDMFEFKAYQVSPSTIPALPALSSLLPLFQCLSYGRTP